MNAATEVMTATRMQHVLIPLDTLNAYVTQGLPEMGVYVQVIYIIACLFFFVNFLLKQSTSFIVQGKRLNIPIINLHPDRQNTSYKKIVSILFL